MDIENIIEYLQNRPRNQNFVALGEQDKSKYITFASSILNTFYMMQQVEKQEDLIQVIGEQTLFVVNNNVDLQKYYEYNALDSFNLGGSIQGVVSSDKAQLVGDFVAALLNAMGIQRIQPDVSDDLFGTYSRV